MKSLVISFLELLILLTTLQIRTEPGKSGSSMLRNITTNNLEAGFLCSNCMEFEPLKMMLHDMRDKLIELV